MLRRTLFSRCAAAATTPAKRVIKVGDTYAVRHTFSKDDVATFARLCGDSNPIHLDDAAAQKVGFPCAIVHGQLVSSLFSNILGMHLPGPGSVYVNQTCQFVAPVLVGDEVEARITIAKFRKDKGLIGSETTVKRVKDDVVAIKGTAIGMNRTQVDLQGETPPW